ncbi:MAG: shikimate kinase / 3-dehydroquinate synthase [Thermomicrobiales bacterium]|nr:shikimate kinase / 3-dehydroquinate synthase [Thermomicrobiales bacterium]
MNEVSRVVLIGFSGTGKTTVARLLAERLGWDRYDTDEELEQQFGMTIPEVFAERGETTFRAAEREQLARAISREKVVIATGGGAVVDPAAWGPDLLGRPGTLVVALDAAPDTMLDRLRRQQIEEGATVERPMLAGSDPRGRIEELKTRRQEAYDRAAITLAVDAVPPEFVAAEIAALMPDPAAANQPTVRLPATSGTSEIYISPGVASSIGAAARDRWPKARCAWIVTDTNVGEIHGIAMRDALSSCGFDVRLHAVAPGEGSKSLTTTAELYDWMLDGGIERGDVIVALGGGVVGDLAGFVAATVLRGVGFVQVPTSLLAMVDASVGGKTGINHRTGKNLIGAFYQPPVVLVDPRFLATMPPRSLTEGWAEVIKHAVIQPSTPDGERADLLRVLERNVEQLTNLTEPATTYVIGRNVGLKAAVVAADEREAGLRALLNFGHTLGHAIEAADYRYLHGEAVAVGMRAAMRIARELGLAEDADALRLDRLIEAYGLPSTVETDPEVVMTKIVSDKKRVAGSQRWVLPTAGGGAVIHDGIAEETVRRALDAVRYHGPESEASSPRDVH